MGDAENSGRQRGRAALAANAFKPGQTGNAGGRPKKVREYIEAIQKQETPALVASVVKAMRQQAIAGGKGASGCARVYFEATGVPLGARDDEDLVEKLKGAPQEVLDYLETLN